MSSVFLTNVDDYLAPSQACINPLFADDNNKASKKKKADAEPQTNGAVVKRRVVRRRKASSTATAPPPPPPAIPQKSATEEFSLADCLACSGCVTTAETVLIEQHSLSTLKSKCQEASKEQRPICVTVSPASLADLMRSLKIESEFQTWYRRLASFLHHACHASTVLDGNVPLGYSLREAAREFCHVYRQQHLEMGDDAMDIDPMEEEDTIPAGTPSVALSKSQTRYMLPNGESKVITHKPGRRPGAKQLPLLTSSCPALVCLVEKSVAGAVPHLASTKSPMAVAGALMKKQKQNCLHVAVMPCHDKKLEASRKDLAETTPDVDLVITTREWLDLLQETVSSANDKPSPIEIRTYLESLPLSPLQPSMEWNGQRCPVLVTEMASTANAVSTNDEETTVFYPHGSGGHADYVFRCACQELFGVSVQKVPWKPVVSQRRARIQSARVSAAQNKNADFYQAALYQHADGTFSCDGATENCRPVLKFATAYGLQNIQRVLQPFKGKGASPSPYHFVEAMACPSGCLNGGGQARVVQRETPTETRERVRDTQRVFVSQSQCGITPSKQAYANMELCRDGPFGSEAQELLHTRFHIVPELQTNGSSNGMIVDTRW